jgi:hypothetical protein
MLRKLYALENLRMEIFFNKRYTVHLPEDLYIYIYIYIIRPNREHALYFLHSQPPSHQKNVFSPKLPLSFLNVPLIFDLTISSPFLSFSNAVGLPGGVQNPC